jgi:hypothetical protein
MQYFNAKPQYITLQPDRIRDTHRRLHERITARFPTSGLSEVAGELAALVDAAAVRAERIRRPNVVLRVAIVLLLLGAVAMVGWLALSPGPAGEGNRTLFELVEIGLRANVFLGAVIVFLITLETRLKRRRALAALHELRALAHVVDMHQVAKSPERLVHANNGNDQNDEATVKTPADLRRYLNYCNELLAIVSKVAALYVQEFPDAPTVAAVDQVENLCAGLSQKIWQKITTLDQLVEEKAPALA